MSSKDIAASAAGFAVLLVMVAVAGIVLAAFIKGGLWLSSHAVPWLMAGSVWALVAVVFVLLPLSIPKALRGYTSVAILIASFVFGVTLWTLGLLLTWSTWGLLGVAVGLFLFGIGVVPVAMLAMLVNGLWGPLVLLVALLIATYGCRIGSMALAESVDS